MLRVVFQGYRDAFSGLPRQVWVLAACLFVNRFGMMVLPFLELYLTGQLDLEVDAAGRLVALYGVGSILGVTAGGWFSDRFGAWRIQVLSLLGSAVLLLVLWRMRTPLSVGTCLFLVGFVADTFRPANGAAISAAAGPEARARSFSLMSLAVNLGLSFGLPLGGLLARVDFAWLFWIDAATSLAAAIVLASLSDRHVAPRPAPEDRGGSPWRDGTFLGVIALLGVTATVLFQFFGALPVFLAHDVGLDEAGVGLTLALNTLVTASFGMLVVRWVERRDDLRWLGVGAFLICGGYGLNALGTSIPLALVSVVVWSVGEMLFFPLGAAFASRRAAAGSIGRFMSTYHLAFAVAFVLAPLLGTAAYEAFGPRMLWVGCAVLGVAVGLAFQRPTRRP